MKLFNKRARGGKATRNHRIFMQKCKAAGIYLVCAGVVCGLSYLLWSSGAPGRVGAIIAERTLAATTAAGFTVKDVAVTGNTHLPRAAILKVAGVRRGVPVFTVDLDAAHERLRTLSWVKEARLSRRLPGTILVEVEERAPFALWQVNKKISLIDAEGVVLATRGLARYEDLPLVVGEGAEKSAAALFTLLKAEPELAKQVSSAVRVGARRWDLYLANGIVVRMPAENEGLALARLARAARKVDLLSKSIAHIDLRLPDRLVIAPGKARGEEKT